RSKRRSTASGVEGGADAHALCRAGSARSRRGRDSPHPAGVQPRAIDAHRRRGDSARDGTEKLDGVPGDAAAARALARVGEPDLSGPPSWGWSAGTAQDWSTGQARPPARATAGSTGAEPAQAAGIVLAPLGIAASEPRPRATRARREALDTRR